MTVNWAVSVTVLNIFEALQVYRPSSTRLRLEIKRLFVSRSCRVRPLSSELVSSSLIASVPRDQVIVGVGNPSASHGRVALLPVPVNWL